MHVLKIHKVYHPKTLLKALLGNNLDFVIRIFIGEMAESQLPENPTKLQDMINESLRLFFEIEDSNEATNSAVVQVSIETLVSYQIYMRNIIYRLPSDEALKYLKKLQDWYLWQVYLVGMKDSQTWQQQIFSICYYQFY